VILHSTQRTAEKTSVMSECLDVLDVFLSWVMHGRLEDSATMRNV